MNQPQCYTCHERPAEGYSAYCESCAPRDTYPLPKGTRAARCGFCGVTFSSDTAFDLHLKMDRATGRARHLNPASVASLYWRGDRWSGLPDSRAHSGPQGGEQAEGGQMDAGGGQGVTDELRDVA